MQNEIYKKIVGYENYSVSSRGNVRNDNSGKMLKPRDDGRGYCIFALRNNNKSKNHRSHRLVAFAFIVNPENKPQVDHIDNNRQNNHVDNLRWVTNSENQQNGSKRSTNTSGTKGVCWDESKKKWLATIMINKKHINLGCFTNKQDAISCRLIRAKNEFGVYINKCEQVV